jgi:Tol biopolymer transport system component
VIAGATGLAAAVLAWIHYREAPVEQPSLRYQLVRPGGARFAHMQVSPDGRNLVYVSRLGTGQGATDKLFVRSLETLEDREFPDSEGALYPFWSPDSTHLAYFSQGKLRQVPVGGGPATEIADVADARGGAWAPDGTIIFAPAVIGGLFRVPALGGTVTPLAKHNAAQQERYSLRFPSFLPDGKHFFFAIESDKSESQGVYVSSLDGGAPVRILPDLSATVFVATPGLSTSGFIFFRRQATLMAQAFDTEQLRTTGEAFVLAGAAPPSGNTGWVDLTATANGTLLYAAGDGSNQERELVWLDRNGKRAGSVLKQKGIKDFAVSRDEKQLLYSLANQSTPGDIYLYDLERGASRRFTFGPSRTYGAVWSPDNATAAFTTYPEDHVYVKNLSAAKEESVPVAGTNSYVSSWSKDGKLLAYSQAGASTKDDLWFLPMDGTRTPRLFKQTPFTERNGQFSPDGLWLAYDSDASGQMEIYVEPSSGGAARQISVAGGFSATWRADGRELYFISNQSVMAVEVTPGADLSFGAPQELFREPTLVPTTIGIAYSPASDGRKFLALLPVGGAPAETLTVVTHWRPNATK